MNDKIVLNGNMGAPGKDPVFAQIILPVFIAFLSKCEGDEADIEFLNWIHCQLRQYFPELTYDVLVTYILTND